MILVKNNLRYKLIILLIFSILKIEKFSNFNNIVISFKK